MDSLQIHDEKQVMRQLARSQRKKICRLSDVLPPFFSVQHSTTRESQAAFDPIVIFADPSERTLGKQTQSKDGLIAYSNISEKHHRHI